MRPPDFEPSHIFSFFIIFCIKGGIKKEKGRDTKNPIPHPVSQADKKKLFIPTLTRVMAKAMHNDIITAIQKPKNNICRILKAVSALILK
jgi:hypothetical protein